MSRRRGTARSIGATVVIVLVAALVELVASPSAGAVTLVAQGRVQQVFVTGATPGETVELLDGSGVAVASGVADEQGAFIFGNHPLEETPIAPGGGYRVRQGGSTSAPVTVLDPGGVHAAAVLLRRPGPRHRAGEHLPGPGDRLPVPRDP